MIGRVLAERFRLEALIGRGAAGEVYLATDTRLRRRVAVKVLHRPFVSDAQFVRRFRSEAQLASRLTHPNILVIHDWHDGISAAGSSTEADDPAYLITEYLDGGSLRAILDRHRKLSLSQVTLIGIEAARGLAHAHSQGIVHRDIKPANLLFASDGSLRIVDFGLARALAEAALTEPDDALVGTARYASPEQVSGHTLDGRSDVYSLAVTLIEAAIGEAPFRADTPIGVLMARQQRPLEPPAEMGVLGEVLAEAGTVDPTNRIDAAELLRKLERITRQLPRPDLLPLVIPTSSGGPVVDVDPTALAPHDALRPTMQDHTTPVVDLTIPLSPQSDAPTPNPRDDDPGDADEVVADEVVDHLDRSRVHLSRRTFFLRVLGVGVAVGAGGVGYEWWRRSSRPKYVNMPYLEGRTEADASTFVRLIGLRLNISQRADEAIASGKVISASPAGGTRILVDSEVSIVVSSGPAPRDLPTLVGRTADEAMIALQDRQLVGRIVRKFDETASKNVVMATQPASGSVPRDSEVVLTVSDGPEPRTVPNVSGMTPEDAAKALPDGLTSTVVEEPSETVPKGIVIAANYKPGSKLPRGSALRFRVSSGPALIDIPATKGLSPATAAERLRSAGLEVTDTEGAPDQPVTGTRPPAGRAVRRGTGVVIITGPVTPE
jgi:eukaryotic-like serine/threonine-protein kinase